MVQSLHEDRSAARATAVAVPRPEGSRLVSLDAFRGLTIAGMLIVNNPGSWGAIYPPLRHAEWHGWTPTDLIFPFFLFIVGVSMSDRKSTRLNSSHVKISYAVFCLKKKQSLTGRLREAAAGRPFCPQYRC